jgi:hypothetical protein
MPDHRRTCLSLAALFLAVIFCSPAGADTAPLLRCQLVYAGASHRLEATVGGDPYTIKSVDIDGRFRFKAVLLGAGTRIDMIKLYAYYETRRQPVLIQEVKYLPPFTLSAADAPYALTGLNYLYAPPLGRELQYGCALVGASS